MFIPGSVGGLHLELTTAIVFFCFLWFSVSSSSMWVSFALFLFLGSFSLWGSLLSYHCEFRWTTNFLLFLSSLCCCVSLYFLLCNLWTLIWSQRTQKDHEVLIVCLVFVFFLRNRSDWHPKVHNSLLASNPSSWFLQLNLAVLTSVPSFAYIGQ